MSAKDKYIECCKQRYTPLFQQPFWLDCVAPGWGVDIILGFDSVAFLACLAEQKAFFSIVRNPLLTPYSGLLFYDDNFTIEQKQHLFDKTLAGLAHQSLSEIDCNPNFTAGIKSNHNKTTYILFLEQSLAHIHSNFKSSLKRQIKKAEKNLRIEEEPDVNRFFDIYTESISRRSKANKTPKHLIKKVFNLCQEKKCGYIFTAFDENNNAHATLLYVEDEQTAYYLLGGTAKEHLGSGAMGLLLWHSIQLAHKRGKKTFDFEGSMEPGVARFFSTFGGTAVRYPILKGPTNKALAIIMKLKSFFS